MTRDPLREWQERYSSGGTRLGFTPETDAKFSSSVQLICDAPGIVRTALSPGLLFRDKSMVRDGNDNRSLVVSLARELNFGHRGRENRLSRFEATVVQNDEPGKAGARRPFAFYEVSIPQREWVIRASHSSDHLMRVINRRSESLQLLLRYIEILSKAGMPVLSETREIVGRHVVDLAVLAASRSEIGESNLDSVVAARRAAILEHIAAHFQDPGLTGPSLAQSLGISQRYLQRLLKETGKPFTEHLNDVRLKRAFDLLLAADNKRRISEIALEVGFSDITHFNRLFKASFGGTPKSILGTGRTATKDRT